MKVRIKYPLVFLTSMVISSFTTSSSLKTVVLLFFWLIAFWPLRLEEFLYFLIFNAIFVLSNFGALEKGAFEFTQKDILLMPWNELFMWGFYFLCAQRFLGLRELSTPFKKTFLSYTFIFAILFSVVHAEIPLLLLSSTLLAIALRYCHCRQDLQSIMVFSAMGAVVETSGLVRDLWSYPRAAYFPMPLWGPLMWANIGLIASRISPWVLGALMKGRALCREKFRTRRDQL